MERGSMEKLKFDRRLARRRGWVGSEELDSHIGSLPDVESKRFVEEEQQAAPSAASETPAELALQAAPSVEEPKPFGES